MWTATGIPIDCYNLIGTYPDTMLGISVGATRDASCSADPTFLDLGNHVRKPEHTIPITISGGVI